MKSIKKVLTICLTALLIATSFVPAVSVYADDIPPQAEGNVSIDITGPGLEYWNSDIPSRITFFINSPQPDEGIIQMGKDNIEFKGDYTIKGEFVPGATGVRTKNPVPIEYEYDGSGTVSVVVKISNASTKITKFEINGTDYGAQCPQTDEEFLNALDGPRSMQYSINGVPYEETYDVVIEAEFDELMGGFGWNYLPEETQSGDSREDCIAHGTLSFVKGEYAGMEFNSSAEWNSYEYGPNKTKIFEWVDGDKNYKDEHDAWGSAAFPRGAVITFKLIPDEGYQLTSLFGDKDLEPQDEPGVYKITMTGGMNSHLMATFTEVGDVVNASAGAVKSGEVSNLSNTYGEGTMKLNVDDTETNAESRAAFAEEAASNGAEIQEYVDINLANTIYKATEDSNDAWDRPVDTLEQPATIKLELENSYAGKDVVVIHEHNGQYETIPTTFDGNNTISFETSSFSNYAIATVTPKEDPGDDSGDEPGDDPAPSPGPEPSDEPEEEKEDYTLTSEDGNFIVEFNDTKDIPFSLMVVDLDNLSDEEIKAMDMTREEYEATKSSLKESIKDEGDFLGVYEIMVVNAENNYEPKGPFKLKIKIPDEMKDYSDFKLFNLNEFGEPGFSPVGITVSIEDGYIIVEVDELGTYAITGVRAEPTDADKPADATEDDEKGQGEVPKKEKKRTAPPTGDEAPLAIWTLLLGLAASGLICARRSHIL